MNSQNMDQQNSSWRPPSYLQESRNQGVSRPDNYYPHYPSSQSVNDYLHGGYVYPPMIPPFRPGEFNMHPINEQWSSAYNLLNNQTYPKYYNKSEPFNVQNTPFAPKNYPSTNNFYEKTNQVRPQSSYDEIKLEKVQSLQNLQLLAHSPSGYLREEFPRIQKVSKSKNVIVIESDEEDQKSQIVPEVIKSAPQNIEQKPLKQLARGIQFQQKKSQILIEQSQKPKQIPLYPQASTIVLEKNHGARQIPVPQIFQNSKMPQQNHGIYSNLPPLKMPIVQYVPQDIVTDLYHQVMQELQIAQIPDISMKLFLKYKIMHARSSYQETQEKSFHVFNLLKIYRTIILFEIERKMFIETVLSEPIFLLLDRHTNIHYNDIGREKSQKRFSELCKNNKNHFKIRVQPDDLRQNPRSDYRGHEMYRQEYSRNGYQHKTKKISKRQSSQNNSDEISNHNPKHKYFQKQDPEQSHKNYSLKLRERKKKKNRRNLVQKGLDKNYNRDKPSQRQNSRPQKQINEKESNKKSTGLSREDEGLAQKIQRWAEKTQKTYGLADTIEQKHKKSIDKDKNKNSSNQIISKSDPFKVIKKDELSKKNKQRSTKSSQSAFREQLSQRIFQAKQAKANKQTLSPNLITFATSNNLTQIQKEEYQKELNHLTKEMRNNDNHGKIRIGKEYFQAKMPNFIDSDKELRMMIKEKREKLMERKMTVLTF